MVGSTPLLARNASRGADSKTNTAGAQEGSGGAGVLAKVEVDLRTVFVAVVRRSHGAEGVAVGRAEIVDLMKPQISLSRRGTREELSRMEGRERQGKGRIGWGRLGSTDLDDDRLGVTQPVPARVGMAGETPAGPAAGAGALAVADAEDVLRRGRRVSRLGEESAGGGLGVAVPASALVAAAVLGDGGLVGLAGDEEGEAGQEEGGGEMHLF